MRLKMRLQPSPKTTERRAMRILATSAVLSIVVFSVFFIYLNLDSKKNAYAESESTVSTASDNILNFAAMPVSGGVKLLWRTSAEVDNDYFTIERSNDGVNFEAIDNIDGSGNTQQAIQYSYVDESPADGINYYRLSQTAFDGCEKTYNPISIKLGDGASSLSVVNVYPNPLNGDFLLTYRSDNKANTTVEILNAEGKGIYTEMLKTDSGVNVYDFSNKVKLNQGIFFVRLSQGKSKTEPVRFVKK